MKLLTFEKEQKLETLFKVVFPRNNNNNNSWINTSPGIDVTCSDVNVTCPGPDAAFYGVDIICLDVDVTCLGKDAAFCGVKVACSAV